MSQTPQQLERLLRVISIISDTDFAWFGRRSEPLKSEIARLLEPEDARRVLVSRISERLYHSYYSVGFPMPADESKHPVHYEDPAFVQALRAANHGSGAWLSGWKVLESSESQVRVQGEDLRLTVPRSRCRLPCRDAIPPSISPGSHVEVQFPCEQLAISPGYYVAQGNEPFSDNRPQHLVRIYFNATPAAAILLMNHLTRTLNNHKVPFEYKVLKSLACSDRCDGAVLYVGRNHLAQTWKEVEDILDEVTHLLRRDVPAFTKQLAPGIGCAENPLQGGSFGDHRCRLLAEGLVRAYEQQAEQPDQRMEVIAKTFAEEGIDLESPFLNPNSANDLPTLAPRAKGTQVTMTRCVKLATSDEFARPASARRSRVGWLEASEVVARHLVDRAIHWDHRCTWMAPLPAAPNSTKHVTTTLDASVYQGTSGVALYLAEVAAATCNASYGHTARHAMRQAFASLDTLCSDLRYGHYSGILGVAWAGTVVGERLADPSLTAQAMTCIRDIAGQPLREAEFDIMGGLAGGILALLAIDRHAPNKASRDLAIRLGDQLASQATRRARGLSWSSRTLRAKHDLTGYSHGVAGVGHAMAALAAATGETRFAEMAEAAFTYEREWFDPEHSNWPDFRPDPQRTDRRRKAFGCSWCHGAPGIGLSRLAAATQLDATMEIRQDAEAALTTTRQWLHGWLQRADDESPCLCHGFLGNADVLILAQAHPWATHHADSDLLHQVAEAAMTRCLSLETTWPKCESVRRDPSLMTGFAGVGHFFLRMAGSASVTAL